MRLIDPPGIPASPKSGPRKEGGILGQLCFTTIGGERVEVIKRGKHHVQQRGYAFPPGTGPAGETCGSCQHIVRSGKYRKCGKNRATWTHGPRTDVLARSAACKFWESADSE